MLTSGFQLADAIIVAIVTQRFIYFSTKKPSLFCPFSSFYSIYSLGLGELITKTCRLPWRGLYA